MSNRLYRLMIGLSLVFLGSCSGPNDNPRPENLIDEDTYIDLMIELQLLRSYQTAVPEDSVRVKIDSLKNVVYRKYGVSEQQFMESHYYYQRQVEPQIDRITGAIDSLKMQMVEDGLMDSTPLE
ncbi:MAG: DUF4296 domain-containing protein [Balneolaceae bacterium]|nr:DUF4296 domain-containing protein [Balneolaceae bacterium]